MEPNVRAERVLLDRTLYHPRLIVRIVSLTALGVALHLLAWSLGYYLLPAEALKGVFLASKVPVVGGSEGDTLLRIVVANLLLGFGLTAAANFFRVSRFPLGYLPSLFHWSAYGLMNGTGSFVVDTSPLSPSLSGLIRNRGSWEILSYTIVAAATIGLFMYRQHTLLTLTARKERSFSEVSLSRSEWMAVAAAFALLVAANWTEALSLMGG